MELLVDAQVWQQWPLFVPPPHWQRGYVITVQLANGASMDLMEQVPVPWYRAKDHGHLEFADDRWLKYFTQFHLLSEAALISFGRYLCSQAQNYMIVGYDIRAVELSTNTQPVVKTSESGMPQDFHLLFDCKSTGTLSSQLGHD